MSVISQFFPSSEGGGSSSKMDVDVFILSGGGGAAITDSNYLSSYQQSGHGGGGAAFQGTIPIQPGSTVPIVVGGGGAGAGPSPQTTSTNGAIGGCSKLTFPEGTICVAGGGGGAHGQLSIGDLNSTYWTIFGDPTTYAPYRGTHSAGTGGSGGCCASPSPNSITGWMRSGPGSAPAPAGEGGRSIYSNGLFSHTILNSFDPQGTSIKSLQFEGTSVQNHKYGQFSGGPGAGGAICSQPTSVPGYRWNSQASGGAGGAGVTNIGGCGSSGLTHQFTAGKGICTDMTGTLAEYGRGRTFMPDGCWQVYCDGEANYGAGGVARGDSAGHSNGGNGGSGTVIVRYPDQFAAAPASPGATDCSPATPGYYTYRFNSTGSITLP
jgi:hypothetical protein